MTNTLPIQIGLPSLRSGASVWHLPPADKGGISMTWEEVSIDSKLIDGSESTRRLGWIPELSLSWAAYNDRQANHGLAIGSNSGQLLDFASLLSVLDAAPGTLKISLDGVHGFTINKSTVAPFGVAGKPAIATGVQITFRGGGIRSTKTLGAL